MSGAHPLLSAFFSFTSELSYFPVATLYRILHLIMSGPEQDEPRVVAEIVDGQVYLTPELERITTYKSPVALERIDLLAVRQHLKDRLDDVRARQAADDELDHIEIGDVLRESGRIADDVFALKAFAELVAAHQITVPTTTTQPNN